jgi:V/A-type H+-transporting ATPase subunit E
MQSLQPAVKEAFADASYVQKLIETVVKGWVKNNSSDLKITVSEAEQKKMEQFFESKLSTELNKGLEIVYSSGIKSGFKAGPVDNSYQISFTEQDFINFFNFFFRPKTSELLFN